MKDVSTILGHSTVAVTADIYTHTLRGDSIAAMNLLATRLERPVSMPLANGPFLPAG